jgi:hypothetical protein
MMVVREGEIRFIDEEIQDQGMSKEWPNAGFSVRLPDFDTKNGRIDTWNHWTE